MPVATRTSRRHRRGFWNANCCASAPPHERPRTSTTPRPSLVSTRPSTHARYGNPYGTSEGGDSPVPGTSNRTTVGVRVQLCHQGIEYLQTGADAVAQHQRHTRTGADARPGSADLRQRHSVPAWNRRPFRLWLRPRSCVAPCLWFSAGGHRYQVRAPTGKGLGRQGIAVRRPPDRCAQRASSRSPATTSPCVVSTDSIHFSGVTWSAGPVRNDALGLPGGLTIDAM